MKFSLAHLVMLIAQVGGGGGRVGVRGALKSSLARDVLLSLSKPDPV